MSRWTMLFWFLLLCLAGFLTATGGCGGGGSSSSFTPPPPPPPTASDKIKHVVVIFQENRTPDNLFQDPVLISRGADIVNSGQNSLGQTIPLVLGTLATNFDMMHDHQSFLAMYDNGKMDGADLIPVNCTMGAMNCPPPNPQFMYVDPTEAQPYFQMAETYTFGDRMFQTNQGPSFPAHQFIISGTSAPSVGSNLFAAENPAGTKNAAMNTGCTAPIGEFVYMIDPSGSEATTMYPCFEHQTLMDELDAKAISWRYYAPGAGSIWTGPNAIQHLRNGADWTSDVVLQQTQVLTDIANGQLAQVSWVIPDGLSSDHANDNDGSGPSWVASIVNAIGSSAYWSDTAIIITWDDWGGWYDHVPPTIINSYEYGFRVPLIVVSPYAKAAYLSHQTHDFGSVLKFIELVYGLTPVGYADVAADNMSDCFNFSQVPLPFQMITAKYGASEFLNRKGPPKDPDDD